jgi:pimeloyl-ACP methyl ester carboxylesterase
MSVDALSGGVPRPGESPEACVARFESASERILTPCGDGHMVWHKWGEGEPVVLFHGGYGSWTHWIRTVPALAERYTVYAADAPGLGDSDVPPKPYTLDGIIDAFETGLRELVPADARMHFVGFSYGSMTSSNTALRFGERIKSLTMCASSRLAAIDDVPRDTVRWRDLETEEEQIAAHHQNLHAMLIYKPERVDDLAVYLQSNNAPRARMRTKDVVPRDALVDALAELSRNGVPILAIWGEGEAYYQPFLDSKATLLDARGIEMEVRTIPDTGHWSPYEEPEQVNAWLLEWFGQHE